MISRLKIVMVAFAALGLAGCSGGGGGGGSAQNSQTQMGSGGTHTAAVYAADWTSGGTFVKPKTAGITRLINDLGLPLEELGTLAKPFWQQSLAYRGITDPNAVVLSPSNVKYDLTWGAPDPAGPGYATEWLGADGTANARTLPNAISVAGHTVSGQQSLTSGITLTIPLAEVSNAWKQGWTGLGQNVLMIDDYPNPDPALKPAGMSDEEYMERVTHGISTYLTAWRYAPGAKFYVYDQAGNFDFKVHDALTNAVPVLAANTHGNLADSVRAEPGFYVDVVNISLGYNYWEQNITNPTQTQIDAAFAEQATWTNFVAGALNGSTPFNNAGASGSANIYLTDAVITKAAGNDTIDTVEDPLSFKLANDSEISPRLLLVGALDGPELSKDIADYSNVAGRDLKIQSRFLMANGGTPYIDGDLAIDGVNKLGGSGTSFAAPRVAGYAAIVRQKFPNLSGANTADILLATARYDTLTCNPNCSKEIYGQGEASLSRALAPVGLLK
jgi:hypothetical protein